MNRTKLITYLDDYLRITEFEDYGPQGLQVEADNKEIERVALSVDVAPPIIEMSATWEADMLLVHHGILWRNVEPIVGPLGQRVRLLLRHHINLYAAHLSLDGHPGVGNNAVLARTLGVEVTDRWCAPMGMPIGVAGLIATEPTLTQLVSQIESQLNTKAQVLAHGPARVHKIAIVSGFGADKVAEAKSLGADTFLTGETSHANYWAAADYAINVIYAGHYATETVGVQALGQHLAEQFGLEVRFFDFPTAM
jgi:dinuclear metal center YbgI/SA1388 family protein